MPRLSTDPYRCHGLRAVRRVHAALAIAPGRALSPAPPVSFANAIDDSTPLRPCSPHRRIPFVAAHSGHEGVSSSAIGRLPYPLPQIRRAAFRAAPSPPRSRHSCALTVLAANVSSSATTLSQRSFSGFRDSALFPAPARGTAVLRCSAIASICPVCTHGASRLRYRGFAGVIIQSHHTKSVTAAPAVAHLRRRKRSGSAVTAMLS